MNTLSRVAWWMVGCGMLSGAVLGLWSFSGPIPAPNGFIAYDDLPRRLLRLAHIAMIALPLLSLELERWLGRTTLRTASQSCIRSALVFGMVALPALLTVTAYWSPALYLLPLPVCALMGSVFVVAIALGRTAQVSP
ncbi:MAG TPA: hypothetical protein VHO25_05885 [Polyangiaceae bacterium]|nr:hypothetical protein [Polyangiaceae bacterium]